MDIIKSSLSRTYVSESARISNLRRQIKSFTYAKCGARDLTLIYAIRKLSVSDAFNCEVSIESFNIGENKFDLTEGQKGIR